MQFRELRFLGHCSSLRHFLLQPFLHPKMDVVHFHFVLLISPNLDRPMLILPKREVLVVQGRHEPASQTFENAEWARELDVDNNEVF